MFTLQVTTDNPEVRFQLAFDPPPKFKSVGVAHDWALTNLPRGEYVEILNKKGDVVAQGFVGLSFDGESSSEQKAA